MTDAQHYDAIVVGTGSYEELEPYYTQAEHLHLVHGRHGEDPTEAPTSAQYPYPPVQHEPRIQQLSHDLEKQGLHPFHLPIGMNLTQDVRRLDTDATGRSVTSVVATVGDGGGEGSTVEFSADIVVVACGAVNSAVLLRRSANDRHPRGLANSSDPLGGIHVALDENNPSLTAIANAPRVGDRIADRLR
jgi:choline dehydrogenase-like flavoprotein